MVISFAPIVYAIEHIPRTWYVKLSRTRKETALTDLHVQATPRRMGRAKLWHENVNLTLPLGAKARMDAVLADGEDRLDLIRAAIDKEVSRRERAKPKS